MEEDNYLSRLLHLFISWKRVLDWTLCIHRDLFGGIQDLASYSFRSRIIFESRLWLW